MNDFILLVSGFGRCGSSLVMQMLDAGGYRVTGEYPAFEDDIALPRSIASPDAWRRMMGRAVKVLDPHLLSLPTGVPFRVIWLDRDLYQQAKSQAKFAKFFMGLEVGRDGRRKLAVSYKADRPRAMKAFANAGARIEIELTFENLIRQPFKSAAEINKIVGGLDVDAMAGIVRVRGSNCYPGMLEMSLLEAASRAI
jgi:hypothetical protein